MEWLGANAISLGEYLENKKKLSELKEKKNFMNYR